MEPTVSVIIPTYNRAHLVGQTIDSVLKQTRPTNEVIVIDDGSTDGTTEVVGAYGERVRYLKQTNAGKSAALNRAMAEVGTDYVWTIDDDDVALPKALEIHLDFLTTHADIDFSYGAYYGFSGEQPPETNLSSSREPMTITTAKPEALFVSAMMGFPFYLQSMVVPRRCYEQVGPFDESLTFNEDYEMILRLARHFRGADVNAPIFFLRSHEGARGPAHERRPASGREANFRRYERKIFTRLFTELPLIDYLPRERRPNELSNPEARQARLQRACIMSRHGLFDVALNDLQIALDSIDDTPLTERERRILAQMLRAEAWWLRTYPDHAATLGRLLRRRRAREALRACAAGLGWQFERSMRRRQFDEAICIGLHLRRLLGAAQLPAFAFGALVQRYRSGPLA